MSIGERGLDIYYLGMNCPKCDEFRVLPFTKDEKIYGHCLRCGYDFEVDEKTVARLEKELKGIKNVKIN